MLGLLFTIERGETLLLTIAALAGGGLLFQAADAFDYAFQAQGRFALSFLGRGVPILLSTTLKIGAILVNAPLLSFAALETVEAAIIAAALFVVYRQTISRSVSAKSAGTVAWRRLLIEGLPLLLSALAIMIYMRSDIIMLGKMAGYQVAGIYAAASQISEACVLFPVALMPALFPILVRWRRRGSAFYHRQFERLFLLAVATGLLFSLTLTFGATTIVTFIFGSNYHGAGNILIVHGWTILFIFIGITQSGYDVTEGLTWFATFRTFVGAALNIGLNLILIPRHGAVGSAVATLVAQSFRRLYSTRYIREHGRYSACSSCRSCSGRRYAGFAERILRHGQQAGKDSATGRHSRMVSALTRPVVLILFNRPEPTAQVFAAIRAAQPPQLFVIADVRASMCRRMRRSAPPRA